MSEDKKVRAVILGLLVLVAVVALFAAILGLDPSAAVKTVGFILIGVGALVFVVILVRKKDKPSLRAKH